MSLTSGQGRGYRYFRGQPLFRFGFGLSFTSFALSKSATDWGVCVDDRAALGAAGPECAVRRFLVEVTNTGTRRGTETVMVYAVPPPALSWSAPVPIKKLVGWEKTDLAPGGKVSLSFLVRAEQLRLIDAAGHRQIVSATFGLEFTNGADEIVMGSFSI